MALCSNCGDRSRPLMPGDTIHPFCKKKLEEQKNRDLVGLPKDMQTRKTKPGFDASKDFFEAIAGKPLPPVMPVTFKPKFPDKKPRVNASMDPTEIVKRMVGPILKAAARMDKRADKLETLISNYHRQASALRDASKKLRAGLDP